MIDFPNVLLSGIAIRLNPLGWIIFCSLLIFIAFRILKVWRKKASNPGFSLEPLQCLAILGKLLRQELQGHIATQAGVLSLVDHTHSTTAELLCDPVVGDGLIDHISW